MADQDTPAELLQALKLVRGDSAPQIESLSLLATKQVKRVRSAFDDPNVVAIGIAEKETEKKSTRELSLCFYVEKKIPISKIKAGHLIPPVMSVGDSKAVFTDVKPIGRLRPQINKRSTPLQSGYSCGRPDETGTLGAIVKKGKKHFILSNSHVLADCGRGKVGDRIIYPGDADRGSKKAQVVALLSDFVAFQKKGKLINRVDAAIAEIDKQFLLDFTIFKGASPRLTIQAKRGMKVVKRGRTSGDTRGVVRDVNFSAVIPYPRMGDIGFIDQVLCSQYSRPGDSGSIVVDKETGKIVGLHFAGSDEGSVFNPIDAVMKALKFRFI